MISPMILIQTSPVYKFIWLIESFNPFNLVCLSLSKTEKKLWDKFTPQSKAIILGISKPTKTTSLPSQCRINLHDLNVNDYMHLIHEAQQHSLSSDLIEHSNNESISNDTVSHKPSSATQILLAIFLLVLQHNLQTRVIYVKFCHLPQRNQPRMLHSHRQLHNMMISL